jgi:nitrate reductase assembly molybdenum cofactor insertion protein NarJ
MDETRPAAPGPPTGAALVRSQLYRLLALLFRYPAAEDLEALCALSAGLGGETGAAVGPEVRAALAAVAGAAAATGLAEAQEGHVRVFGHVTLPDCPLYETACDLGDPFAQAQALADLAGFYRAFGLDMAPAAGERADHLSVELEFMHYLAYREAFAQVHHGADALATIRDGERRFLHGHLGRWAPVVARAVAARAQGLLGAAGRLLLAVVERDCAAFDARPAPVLLEGAAPGAALVAAEPDDDEMGGEP